MMPQELITYSAPELTIQDAMTAAIVPEPLAQAMEVGIAQALGMEVTDNASRTAAAASMNQLAKCISSVEARVKELRKPLLDAANGFSEQGREAVTLAKRAVDEQAGKIQAYDAKVEAERQAAIREQQRFQAEEERRRREAAEAARQAAEKMRLEAEAKLREAERLKFEAEEKERRAAATLATEGPRTPATFNAGAKGLAKAAEADAAAATAQAEADAQAREVARLNAEAEEAERLALAPVVIETVPMPEETTKAKGIRSKMVPKIHAIDMAALPMAYHLADEAKILKHLKDGLAVPGVTFTMSEVIAATRR